ncbi:hypothetical protein PG985_007701 [Apiospora marii]|uniref:uncharacterized protein n=1 Tax=Apiospora marii TaxID=335849 RepID=UPI00312DDFBE
MLSPLVLIPAFLGTAVYAIATTPIPSTFATSTTSSTPCPTAPSTPSTSPSSLKREGETAQAPPVEGRDLPPFDPFSIPPIPNFAVPSATPVPRPGCSKYVCYVECRIGIVTSACKGCCDKPEEPKQKGDEEKERLYRARW